ncbi:MAG: hypothetical protein IJY48_08030, partial [Mailhella sp.]|nr:hypothetical protein [Mailhella sp.]
MLRWRFAVVALLLGFFAFTTPASADSKIPLSQQQARLFQRAGEHYKKNQFSRVRELLQTEAKDRENPHPYACILYGLSCLQEGKAAEASNIFFKGLAKHPKNFSLNNNLAISLMREGKYEAAAERFQFTATLASEAGRNDMLFSAAQCWYSARKYGKAATIAEKLVSQPSPRTEWVRLTAVANMGLKNWKKAE